LCLGGSSEGFALLGYHYPILKVVHTWRLVALERFQADHFVTTSDWQAFDRGPPKSDSLERFGLSGVTPTYQPRAKSIPRAEKGPSGDADSLPASPV
jgi:hypothetical protein